MHGLFHYLLPLRAYLHFFSILHSSLQQVLWLQKHICMWTKLTLSQATLGHNQSTFDPIPGREKRHALATHQCVLSPTNRLVSITTVLLLKSTMCTEENDCGKTRNFSLFGKRLALSTLIRPSSSHPSTRRCDLSMNIRARWDQF